MVAGNSAHTIHYLVKIAIFVFLCFTECESDLYRTSHFHIYETCFSFNPIFKNAMLTINCAINWLPLDGRIPWLESFPLQLTLAAHYLTFFKGALWYNKPRPAEFWTVCAGHVPYSSEGHGCWPAPDANSRDGPALYKDWRCWHSSHRGGQGKDWSAVLYSTIHDNSIPMCINGTIKLLGKPNKIQGGGVPQD